MKAIRKYLRRRLINQLQISIARTDARITMMIEVHNKQGWSIWATENVPKLKGDVAAMKARLSQLQDVQTDANTKGASPATPVTQL